MTICKPFGIPVKLDWSFWLCLILWATLSGIESGVLFIAVMASVLLHELGHCLSARRHGFEPQGITLYAFGGLANIPINGMPNPTTLEVALAGPAVSLLLAALCTGAAFAIQQLGIDPAVVKFLFGIAVINGVLLVFNLLPIYPLDGGRVAYALLKMGLKHNDRARVAMMWLSSIVGMATIIFFIMIHAWVSVFIVALFGGVGLLSLSLSSKSDEYIV